VADGIRSRDAGKHATCLGFDTCLADARWVGPTGTKAVAILLGCGGVAILLGIGSLHTMRERLPAVGMYLLAVWIFGLGTVMTKKYPLEMTTATSVGWQGLIGSIPALILAFQELPVWPNLTYAGLGALLFISVEALSVAYFSWFRALNLVPASTAAMAILVTPVVGVIVSMLTQGEVLGLRQVAARGLTLSGVTLAPKR